MSLVLKLVFSLKKITDQSLKTGREKTFVSGYIVPYCALFYKEQKLYSGLLKFLIIMIEGEYSIEQRFRP